MEYGYIKQGAITIILPFNGIDRPRGPGGGRPPRGLGRGGRPHRLGPPPPPWGSGGEGGKGGEEEVRTNYVRT